jgi:imidazolonepropionase-like amidohydrolase
MQHNRLGRPGRVVAGVIAASAAAVLLAWRPVPPSQPTAVAITNATVIDVETGAARGAQTVVVQGNRMVAVGASATTRPPAGARILDGTGKFVIPGLWDMHVHATGPGLEKLFLPLLVANGVTGVRDMFSRLSYYDSARAMSARGELVTPRIVGSGHILDGAPAIWPTSVVARTPAEGEKAVDSLASAGAAFIKVYARLTPETFRAIAARAKARGLPFAGHVPSLVQVDEALALGMRSIEHVTMFTTACSRREATLMKDVSAAVATTKGWDSAGVVQRGQLRDIIAEFDPARCQALAQRVARSNTWIVPTITVLRSTSHLDDTTQLRDPRLRFIPKFFSSTWNPANDFRFRVVTAEGWRQRKRVYERQLEVVRILHRARARFLAGTDLANPYIFPGFSLHDELVNFVAAGFTPLEALQTATLNPARFWNATDSLGTVSVGKVADLVVLDANPLADIKNVGRVYAVVLNGRLLDAAERTQLLADGVKVAGGRD